MRNLARGLCGISPASLLRGLRFGLREFMIASFETTLRVQPFDSILLGSLPLKTLDQILAGRKIPIILDVQAYEDGMLPRTEASALLALIALARPTAVLEIGTYMGFTAKAIAQNLPEAIVHTLDLPLDYQAGAQTEIPKDDLHLIEKRNPGREFIGTPEGNRIRQHFGDSATWDFSAATGATCFFIDGSHTYEHCKIDSEKCFQLCDGRGVFLWHDCDDAHPGVVRCLAEWRRMGRDIVRIRGTQLAYWYGR